MAVRDGLIRAFFNAFIIKNMPAQRKMALRTQFSKPLCLRSESCEMISQLFLLFNLIFEQIIRQHMQSLFEVAAVDSRQEFGFAERDYI